MAFTISRYNTVFGNKKVVGLDITADAATQSVETGLAVIEWINVGKGSMSTANIKIAVNSNPSGVATSGELGISGCASGDRFFVTCYGR